MKFFRNLLACLTLTISVSYADESTQQILQEVTTSPEMVTISSDTAAVPEPSSAVFAGIGGLALLFFVLRRRTSETY